MGNEGTQQVRCCLEGAAVASGRSAQSIEVEGRQVSQGIHLDIAPDRFHRIEFRGVRRQEMRMEVGVSGDKALGELGPVGQQPVPDEDEGACEVGAENPQEVDDPAGRDIGVGMEPETQAHPVPGRGNAKGRDGRHLLMPPRTLIEHRGMAAAPPGPPHQRRHQEAAFVEEDQPCFAPRGFFLMRGHSILTQLWIAASFRSTARRWGFWGLQPKACKSRPT